MSETTAAALIIPKFNGDFENWIEFRDKFAELVDGDSGLSGVQKFTFLEYSLTGGPVAQQQLIDSLEVSGANYATLWKRVSDEYGDPSEARRYHVAKLFDSEELREDNCSPDDLRRLIDEFSGHVAALKRLQVPTETWDPLVHLLGSKLPPRIKKRWKLKFFLSSRAEKLTEMIKFLEGEYKYLKRRDGKRDLNRRINAMEIRFAAEGVNHCPVCYYGNHVNLDKCKTFREISRIGRVKLVKELEYCPHCLWPPEAPKHREICDEENHDELLLLSKSQLKAVDIKDRRVEGFSNFQTHYPLRATVRACMEDSEGKSRSFRAFLGTGDEPNAMSKKLCDLLGHPLYPPSKKFSKLTNILEEKTRDVLGYTEVKVRSRVGHFEESMWFVVVNELDCKEYPEPNVRLGDISIPRVVTLADPHFDRPEPVDVVFGATSFGSLLEQGYVDAGDPDQPIWQETVFGWIAAGNVRVIDNDSPKIEWEYLRNPKSSDCQETFFKKYSTAEATVRVCRKFAQYSRARRSLSRSPTMSGPNDPELVAKIYAYLTMQRRLRSVVPKFNGDYDKWDEFCRKFDALVHGDPRLTDRQKFDFLRGALTGPARQLISSIDFKPENYGLAWRTINDRFRDSRELKQHHISEIFNRKAMSENSSQELRELIDAFDKNLSALSGLQAAPVGSWDLFTVHLLKSKLTPFLRQKCERRAASTSAKDERLSDVMTFLRGMVTTLANGESSRHRSREGAKKLCPMCQGNHDLAECRHFIELDAYARINAALKLDCCFNCLMPGHDELSCKCTPACAICDKQHHELLHLRINQTTLLTKQPQPKVVNKAAAVPAASIKSNDIGNPLVDKIASMIFKSSLKPTAVVYLYDHRGELHECRVLLDSDSQQHWISRQACQRLGLDRRLSGWNAERLELAEVRLRSRLGDFETRMLCRVTRKLDRARSPRFRWREREQCAQIPQSMQLADPRFDRPSGVDMVVGARQFYRLLASYKRIKINRDRLVLQESVLGWIVMGAAPGPQQVPRDGEACNERMLPCNIM
ncbi:unnamed protein product [Trichogramma brassicae]|uniref:Uncharacterized protein n=1 Tax=Trichogramma brassicae TaxID=86971 RepID=A0A6H5IGS6_9HYME|nr:unnamed protein product [Trichogramma brassicae]